MANTTDFMVVLPDGRRFGPASIDIVEQWAREGRVPAAAQIEPADGLSPARPVLSEPRLMAVLGAPPTVAGQLSAPAGDGGVSTLIPYKNGHALAAYYLGIAGLIPLLGIVPAPIALALGISGAKRYRANPAIKGIVHAWIGIILGLLGVLISGGLITLMIVGMFA